MSDLTITLLSGSAGLFLGILLTLLAVGAWRGRKA